jgi:hypothetical protein
MKELLGYVGPGAGLGLMGSLLAVVTVIAIGALGLILFPLKLAMAWIRKKSANAIVEQSPAPQRRPTELVS